jgi:hypothetical protein
VNDGKNPKKNIYESRNLLDGPLYHFCSGGEGGGIGYILLFVIY